MTTQEIISSGILAGVMAGVSYFLGHRRHKIERAQVKQPRKSYKEPIGQLCMTWNREGTRALEDLTESANNECPSITVTKALHVYAYLVNAQQNGAGLVIVTENGTENITV